MIVAGIGCRSGVTAEQVEAALAAALLAAVGAPTLSLIAAPEAKRTESAIAATARAKGVPLTWVSQADLEAANTRTLTRSERALTTMNVNSVAEAAALAGAGAESQLLGPRVVVGPVTCALAAMAAQAVLANACWVGDSRNSKRSKAPNTP